MQSNQNMNDSRLSIIDTSIWESLFKKFEGGESISSLDSYIQEMSLQYNIDKKNIIKDYLKYIIRNKLQKITSEYLKFIENIMHFQECKNAHYINYTLSRLSSFTSNSISE
jgi:hypothetical protein